MPEALTQPHDTAEPTRLHVVSVDETYDADQAARDAANERLTEELNEGGRLKRFTKNIWKGGALREYYQHKYTREARAEIEASGNTLLYQADAEQSRRAKRATIDRFLHESDEVIHEDAGESRETVDSDSELSREVKDLIRRNVEGDLSDEAMVEEKARLLAAYHEARGDQAFARGVVQVDNMTEVAAAVKGAIAHGESLNDVMRNMRISTGEARSGVRTEARYNKVERIADKLSRTKVVDKLGRTKLGALVNPETIATATTVAGSLLRYGSHSLVGAATKTIMPGISAGMWAGLRENKRMKDERAQHARERAQGKEIQAGSKRREKLEETRYETATATDLTDMLRQHFGEDADFTASKEAYEAAMAALSVVETRISLSDERKIDLVSFSDGSVEEERFALDLARAEAKVAARNKLTADARRQLGVDENVSLEAIIGEQSEAFLESIETDIAQKDRVFKKVKAWEVTKAAGKGMGMGLLVGGAFQEALAAASDTRVGLVEQAWGADNKPYEGAMHQTLLHGLTHGSGDLHHEPSGDYVAHSVGEHGTISVSADQSLSKNPDGTLLLKDHNGNVIADRLTTKPDGGLTDESLQRLDESGSKVEDLSRTVDLPPKVETHMGSLDEYMDAHKGETTHVTRDFWYDNDTAKFDQNEQKIWWGGEDNNGITKDGDYQFDISHMSADGSSHDGKSLAWEEAAKNGELKMAISASANDQTHVFMIDIETWRDDDGVLHGAATIPKDSPAAQFFSTHDGQASFDGKFAELVQTTEPDADGVVHIRPLATEVGNDTARMGDFPIRKEIPVQEYRPEYKITSDGYDTPTFTEMAPVVPVVSRRPLEKLRRGATSPNRSSQPPEQPRTPEEAIRYYGYNGNYEMTPEQRAREFSPSISDNPGADLELGRELAWFADELRRREGDEYMARLEETVNGSTELRDISPSIRTITTIPVAAANESENIYGALSVYGQQDQEQIGHNVILLNVNWLDIAKDDPEKRDKINKTFAEIERARRDFPELKIAVMTRQYDAAQVQSTGGPIGYVASDLMNTALYALHRGVEGGTIASDSDVAVIRQDADMKGMSRHYLAHLEKSMDKHPGVDIFNGTIRSDVRMQERYPGFGIVTNFSQSLRVAETAANKPWTVGINTVARASSLAAAGGLGKPHWTGAGSDDMQIGWRIGAARRGAKVNQGASGYGYGTSGAGSTEVDRRIVAQVGGMTVDSAADRLIPKYLQGMHYGAAWGDPAANGGTGFSNGPGGYRARDADAEILARNPRERITDGKIYDFIETNFNEELRGASEASARKVLAVFFGSVPGAYKVKGIGTPDVEFTLTAAGRKFLKNRIQRESDGKFGSYGLRKMRQQYGISGTRKPAHAESPLVPALA